jgi:hypothetical protein
LAGLSDPEGSVLQVHIIGLKLYLLLGLFESMKQAKPLILQTTLIQVNSKSDSLKTTVPKTLIDAFELKKGDTITWVYTPQKNIVSIDIPNSSGNNGEGCNDASIGDK